MPKTCLLLDKAVSTEKRIFLGVLYFIMLKIEAKRIRIPENPVKSSNFEAMLRENAASSGEVFCLKA